MRYAAHRVYRYLSLFVCALFIAYGSQCFSEEVIIMGNYDKPPKYYLENKEAKGILIDIMKYVDQNMSHSFAYRLYPWKRAYINAINREGGIVGLSMNSERLKIFDYSDVMFYDELVLVVLKGNEFAFEGVPDLKGKIVGVQRGSSYGEEFENGKNKIFTPDEDKHGKQRLLKLLTKRIDVAILGPGKAGLDGVINQSKELIKRKDEFVILPRPFKIDPNYLGFAKTMGMKGFLHEFNSVLAKGLQTGAIQKIIEKHIKNPVDYTTN